jgi:hypothetical protein
MDLNTVRSSLAVIRAPGRGTTIVRHRAMRPAPCAREGIDAFMQRKYMIVQLQPGDKRTVNVTNTDDETPARAEPDALERTLDCAYQ